MWIPGIGVGKWSHRNASICSQKQQTINCGQLTTTIKQPSSPFEIPYSCKEKTSFISIMTSVENQTESPQKRRFDEIDESADRQKSPVPIPISLLKNPRYLLSKVCSSKQYRARAKRLIEAGIAAKRTSHYSTALSKLQRAQTLLQLRNLKSAKLCLHLGQVLAYFGEWEKAELVLKEGQLMHLKPKLGLQIGNSLAEVYFQAARWEEAVGVCREILGRWSGELHSFEFYRTIGLMANSLEWIGDSAQAEQLVQEWLAKLIPRGWHSECLHQLIQADLRLKQRKDYKGKEALENAKTLFPRDILVACSRERLGFYMRSGTPYSAMDQHVKACRLYLTHFPQSYSCAHSLHRLGDMHTILDDDSPTVFKRSLAASETYNSSPSLYDCDDGWSSDESEDICSLPYSASGCYLLSCRLLSSRFPQYLSRYHFDVLDRSNLDELKEQELLEWCDVYSIMFPQSLTLADIHNTLADSYMLDNAKDKQMKEHALKACDLYAKIRHLSHNYVWNLLMLTYDRDKPAWNETVYIKIMQVSAQLQLDDDYLVKGSLSDLYQ